jgi:hypothetical protein
MKRGRFSSAIIPVLAFSAVAGGITTGTAAAASHAPARPYPATASGTVVINCQHSAQVQPGNFVLACADGNDYLTGLTWTNWTSAFATATGTEMQNDCTPYCAAGKFHSYPAHVIFWRSEPVARHAGEKYFTRVTLLYPGARPPAYTNGKRVPGPDSSTTSLWS